MELACVPVSCRGSTEVGMEPTEQEVFQCLCKDYGSSAGFSEIADRKDLFPSGPKSAETWLRETTKGSILVTEDMKGKITGVHAFSRYARLCLDYSYNGKCDNHDCTYLHICRDYMTNSCNRGVTCGLNHRFHNQRDRTLLSKVNFDQFTDLQLQMLVLLSTPQICVKYNTDGKCKRGDCCSKIHICHGYLRKRCRSDECGLLHETAMDTVHTKSVLKRFMLSNVDKQEVMKMFLDNELGLLSDSCDKTMLNNDGDKQGVMHEPSLTENATTECECSSMTLKGLGTMSATSWGSGPDSTEI